MGVNKTRVSQAHRKRGAGGSPAPRNLMENDMTPADFWVLVFAGIGIWFIAGLLATLFEEER